MSVFLGYSVGTDSNVTQASSGEKDDSFSESLLGLGYRGGNGRNRLDLVAQYRMVSYADNTEYDLVEQRAGVFVGGGSRKLHGTLKLDYALLGDPVDLAVTSVLERTKTVLLPAVDVQLGTMGVGVSYGITTLAYADAEYLDNADAVLSIDVNLGEKEKGVGSKFIAHIDQGTVDFDNEDPRTDFDYTQMAFGWRDEKEHSWGMELLVGQKTVTDDDTLDESATVTKLKYTKLMSGGSAGVEFLYQQDFEAAANADLKKVDRLYFSYTKKASSRLHWLLSVKYQTDEYIQPDSGTAPDTLTLMGVAAGMNLEIGSPNKFHGRLYTTVDWESRSADDSSYEFDRMRLRAGFALVY
jgi:hypothetical protein